MGVFSLGVNFRGGLFRMKIRRGFFYVGVYFLDRKMSQNRLEKSDNIILKTFRRKQFY